MSATLTLDTPVTDKPLQKPDESDDVKDAATAAAADAPIEEPPTPSKPWLAARVDDIKRLWNQAGLVRAWKEHPMRERPKEIGASLLRGGIIVLGFRNALKEWMDNPPKKRSKGVMKGIAGMVADRITGKLVVDVIKFGILFAAAGLIGGSIVTTALVFAAARGTGVFVYTYGKGYLHDRLEQGKTGKKASVLSLGRLGSAGLGFAGSAIGGAAGGAAIAMFVQTDAGRFVFTPLREAFNAVGLHPFDNMDGKRPDVKLVEDVLGSTPLAPNPPVVPKP